jgi:hypothetical protein
VLDGPGCTVRHCDQRAARETLVHLAITVIVKAVTVVLNGGWLVDWVTKKLAIRARRLAFLTNASEACITRHSRGVFIDCVVAVVVDLITGFIRREHLINARAPRTVRACLGT